MIQVIQKYITETSAVKIAEGLERAIRDGALPPGQLLPPVRVLAGELNVNPATIASAYQSLQSRALVTAQGRQGTRVTHRPLAAARRRPLQTPGAFELSDGNPDPALLPNFSRIIKNLDYAPHLYGEPTAHPGLIKLMRREMERDGIRAPEANFCVVNGTMDGLDRLLAEHLRPGDRVAVEDPGFTGHHDLIASRALTLVPVAIDEEGMLPDALKKACRQRVHAILITPRAQSPTGATITAPRARELRHILQRYLDVLLIEDDHLSFLCEGEYHALHDGKPPRRWAHLRSLSKSFNPDLRLAIMTGDDHTITRLLDRLIVVERWVSHLLQSTAHALLVDKSVRQRVRQAGRAYEQRRRALIEALTQHDIQTFAPQNGTGYNVWVNVDEETPTVQGLASRGWMVAAGERFRLSTRPGIRITAARLRPADAKRFAADLARTIRGPRIAGPV